LNIYLKVGIAEFVEERNSAGIDRVVVENCIAIIVENSRIALQLNGNHQAIRIHHWVERVIRTRYERAKRKVTLYKKKK
jgi:hypothetical protein